MERILEYLPKDRGGIVPSEAARSTKADVGAGAAWPAKGGVAFENVSLRDRPGLPLALAETSFTVDAGAKVGIVGRTGSGKSTILVALFRLVEIAEGTIRIDGVDASSLGLALLRKSLSIIPQETVLLEGTARDNCDPFKEHSDAEVSDALAAVGLSRELLHVALEDDSLSGGERQLLALARALLRRSNVVCFDEATAHVDAATDQQILRVVHEQFRGATLLATAHRLHTIIAFDQVIVMDAGRVAEAGAPAELLERTDGPFAAMTDALGPAAKEELRELARKGWQAPLSDVPLTPPVSPDGVSAEAEEDAPGWWSPRRWISSAAVAEGD